MDSRPTVLFVFFEGLVDTVIDSQVLAHARAMADLGVAEFEIFAFAWNDAAYARSMKHRERAEALAGAPVRVIRGYRPGLPFSPWLNARLLAREVRRSSRAFTCVHARTDYSVLPAAPVAKSLGAALIWDCRGDSAAELSFRAGGGTGVSGSVNRLRRVLVERRAARAARLADRAIFVSRALKARMRPWWGGRPCEVIPGAASEDMFFFDPHLRDRVRRDLGLAGDRRIYVYAGGLAPYQEFPATVTLFGRIAANDPAAVFLVVTRDIEGARHHLGGCGNVILRSAVLEEVNGYLNAADAAFMLRESVPTNTVAFPTKFAEYGLAGLAVVMTDAVTEAYAMAREIGNLVEVEDAIAGLPRLDRAAVMRAYRERVTKRAQAPAYRRLYAPSRSRRNE